MQQVGYEWSIYRIWRKSRKRSVKCFRGWKTAITYEVVCFAALWDNPLKSEAKKFLITFKKFNNKKAS